MDLLKGAVSTSYLVGWTIILLRYCLAFIRYSWGVSGPRVQPSLKSFVFNIIL